MKYTKAKKKKKLYWLLPLRTLRLEVRKSYEPICKIRSSWFESSAVDNEREMETES